MIYLSEVRKSPEGLAFNEAPSLLESIKERYDQVLNLEQLQASGQVVYDNGLYLLDYQLSYDITLPSSRSLEPVTLGFNYLVSETFIQEADAALQKELVEENLVLILNDDTIDLNESILDNIRMGNPNATEEQVIEAAKAAQCHEFISKLPNGYKTVFGTKGIHLSGGERQRIAIARAIIKDSPIIVLDEATAFSDPENEYLIQKAFEKLMQNKTVIIIAHRLSTIRNADKIIVMEKGHLVEEGKHNELVAAGGRYSQMWNHYTEAVDWKISGKAV